jgi:hypothetical protein
MSNINLQSQMLATRGYIRPLDTIQEAVESIKLSVKVEEDIFLDLNIIEEF